MSQHSVSQPENRTSASEKTGRGRGPYVSVRDCARKTLSITQILHWAFVHECASLELPERVDAEERGFGFGMEYVLIQRAILGGMQIDGGGAPPSPHEDAEAVAAVLSNLPDYAGGMRMAVRIAELSRAGREPDWMPGAVPQVVPREWGKENQHGRMAKTELVNRILVQSRGRMYQREVRCCPIMWSPSIHTIKAARQAYGEWWGALLHVRDSLQTGGVLREYVVSDAMPRLSPWRASK